MKESTKKYFKLSLILYVVILSVAVIGTLAWFNVNRTAKIPNEEANILTGKNVEICVKKEDAKDEKWGSTIELTQTEKMPDVSMAPDGTFWYPTSLDKEDGLIFGEEGRGLYLDVTEKDGYFTKIPLKVRSNEALNLYLDGSSFVKGVSISDDDETTTSVDAIAGAVRVAIFEIVDGEKVLKTVWVPNESYQIVDSGDGVSVNLTGTPEETYKYLNVTDFKNGNRNQGIVKESASTIAWQSDKLSIGKDSLVLSEDPDDETKPVYVKDAKALLEFDKAGTKELEVYVWVEGTDRESVTFLAGGTIAYELNFIGVETKKEAGIDIEQVSYDAGNFYYQEENVNDKILYSFDSESWTLYSTNNPKFTAGKTVQIRVAETKTEKLGEPREFTIS